VPLRAQQPNPNAIQMEVVPQSLELPSCDPGSQLLVIARNPGTQTAALQISSFSDAPVQILSPPKIRSLAPHQETSWQLQVTCGSDFTSGNLQIVLSDKLGHGGGNEIAQIITRSVAVKLREVQPLDNLAAIEVKSTLESLHKGDAGELTLFVTNKTGKPFDATITPAAPEFITLTSEKKQPVTVDGRSTQVIQFTAKANGQVYPGKHLILFNVLLDLKPDKLNFVLSRDVDVGVLGESEILKLLGVPSLFLLPGFLAVSAFMLLWRWKVMRTGDDTDPPLEETKSGFWVVSVTASLLITGMFILHRNNFFSYYGLGDLMTVWFVSIGIGCGAYCGFRAFVNNKARQLQEALDEHTRLNEKAIRDKYPQTDDTPVQVLHKLSNFGKKMALGRAMVKGQKNPLFLLWVEDDFTYVCPGIGLKWKHDADSAVQGAIEDQLKEDGDPGIVANILDAELAKKAPGPACGIQKLEWNTSDGLHHGPQKVAQADIEGSELEKAILLSISQGG
jgi:hypothetical protein